MKRFIKKMAAVSLAAAFCTNSMLTSSASSETVIIQPIVTESSVLSTSSPTTNETLTLDKSEITLQENGSGGIISITATGGASGTAVSAKSQNAEIAAVEINGTRLFITPKAAGVVEVEITYGSAKAKIKVTVTKTSTPQAKSFKFYSDKEMKTEDSTYDGIWVNGGNVTMPDKTKVNYKDLTVYTDFEQVLTDPRPDDSKVESKAGKALIGITAVTTTKAPYENNKVVTDDSVSKIVKASYKKGQIKVTPGSEAGSARVWLMDVMADGTLINYNSFVVDVKAAAANIILTDSQGVTAKAVGLSAGQSATYSFKGYLKDKKTVAADSTYTVSVDNKYAENIGVNYNESAGTITVTGIKTNNGKAVKAKVTVMCNQSGKKFALTVTVTNPTSTLKATLAEGEKPYLHWKGDTTRINIVETTAESLGTTTDKVKVYVSDDTVTPLSIDEKGKIKYTKSKAAAGTYKNGVLTLKRNDPTVVGTVYLVYTDSGTKQSKAFKICDIDKIVISEGGVKLA